MSKSISSELKNLIDVSARLGHDPLLVQAGSGNTSIKLDGVLWVKASGKWLARAADEEIFVPVDLAKAWASVEQQSDFAAVHANSSGPGLKPSIETAMHAVTPLAATIHVHSVNTIAWAVRQDGPAHLANRLAGLRWNWIPYAASGLVLAKEIKKALYQAPETEIFVLGNHGLVVCGEEILAAEALLDEVERRLAIESRPAPDPDWGLLERITRGSRWRLPDLVKPHALSTDAGSRSILLRGMLYPCQGIFLGPATPLLDPLLRPSEAAERYESENDVQPCFFLVDGHGVIVRDSITAAESEMLMGLTEIVQRIDIEAPIRYLTSGEWASILNAETRHYRSLVELGESRRSYCSQASGS